MPMGTGQQRGMSERSNLGRPHKRDVTSKNANKEHGSKDIPAVIDITDQDQAKVSILSSTSPKKNTRNGGRGRGEEHNWVTISSLRLTETDNHVLLEGE